MVKYGRYLKVSKIILFKEKKMNTEIVRRLDELNRVVLPTDARKAVNIVGTDVVKISWEEDKIIIKKAYPTCKLCGSENGLNEKLGICRECIEKIKAE